MNKELFGGGKPCRITAWKSEGRKPAEPHPIVARMPLWNIRLGIVLEPEGFAGMIVVPRAEDEMRALDQGRAPRSRYELVETVFHESRQARHIRTRYGTPRIAGEKNEMLAARRIARELTTQVLDADRPVTATVLRDAIQTPTAHLAEIFDRTRRPLKRAAADQVTAISRGTDSQGHTNAPATIARSLTISRRAITRTGREILSIEPRIAARATVCEQLIYMAQATLRNLVQFFDEQLLADQNTLLRRLSRKETRKAIAANLGYFAIDFDEVDFRPFRNAYRHIADDLREAQRLIHACDTSLTLWRLLVRIRNATKLKELQIELERVIYVLPRHTDSHLRAPNEHVIENCFGRIMKELTEVDESGFKRQVAKTAALKIGVGLMALSEGGAAHFPEVRKCLKRASVAL
jgi:hypothetical protein